MRGNEGEGERKGERIGTYKRIIEKRMEGRRGRIEDTYKRKFCLVQPPNYPCLQRHNLEENQNID